ncbi:MAG: NAD(P)-dependent oxidoreductase [Patescibacteria group bacterium]
MIKFNKISVVDHIKITDEAEAKLQELSVEKIRFPTGNAGSKDEYIKRIGDADAVIGSWVTTINEGILASAKNIKYIGICGTSLANIDIQAVEKRGITLRNVTDYGDEATAEYIFMQLLILFRGYGKYQWKKQPSELFRRAIGIVGLGAVGQEVARLALGFGMMVYYYSRSRKSEWEEKGLVYKKLHDILMISDIISLHVPKNLAILSEDEFRIIRPNTVLVDTSLGAVVDRNAFQTWIEKKENYYICDINKKDFFGDVVPDRVIGLSDPIAGITIESRQRLSEKFLHNIKSYLAAT